MRCIGTSVSMPVALRKRTSKVSCKCLPRRNHGHERRLVGHQQVLVLKHDALGERRRRFGAHITKVGQAAVSAVRFVSRQDPHPDT